jgi:penicillin-binding protein 1A
MGIGTDLSTSETKYSVGGGPFEPYNPALILGGLETGVTPLEMAHAFLTLQHGGQIVSGTMADSPNGPVAINKVGNEPPGSGGDLIEPNDGGPGYDKVETKQVVPPEVAATARGMLHGVVTEGTGTNANTGDPTQWGKTGTTENNGDAWFVGANQDVTIAVWVGHANSLKPMETEYGGGPVDGGTIPALIFNEVVGAYEELKAQESRRNPSTTTTTTGAVPTTPAAPAPSAPAPATPATPSPSAPATPPESQSTPPAQSTPPSSAGGGSAGGAPPTGGVSG